MNQLPWPSNDPGRESDITPVKPWQKLTPGEIPPMMFQIRFRSGTIISYAYSDLRETRLRDSGFLQLSLFGMEKYQITIEGRHLDELATHIGLGKVRWLAESDDRDYRIPEASPAIEEITIEALTGP